jgi:hypothetical protein
MWNLLFTWNMQHLIIYCILCMVLWILSDSEIDPCMEGHSSTGFKMLWRSSSDHRNILWEWIVHVDCLLALLLLFWNKRSLFHFAKQTTFKTKDLRFQRSKRATKKTNKTTPSGDGQVCWPFTGTAIDPCTFCFFSFLCVIYMDLFKEKTESGLFNCSVKHFRRFPKKKSD